MLDFGSQRRTGSQPNIGSCTAWEFADWHCCSIRMIVAQSWLWELHRLVRSQMAQLQATHSLCVQAALPVCRAGGGQRSVSTCVIHSCSAHHPAGLAGFGLPKSNPAHCAGQPVSFLWPGDLTWHNLLASSHACCFGASHCCATLQVACDHELQRLTVSQLHVQLDTCSNFEIVI